MRAVLVIGGFGLIPLLPAIACVWLRRPVGRAQLIPFIITGVFGVAVIVGSLIAMQFAGGMMDLALVIPMMMGVVTAVASLIAIGVQALTQQRASA